MVVKSKLGLVAGLERLTEVCRSNDFIDVVRAADLRSRVILTNNAKYTVIFVDAITSRCVVNSGSSCFCILRGRWQLVAGERVVAKCKLVVVQFNWSLAYKEYTTEELTAANTQELGPQQICVNPQPAVSFVTNVFAFAVNDGDDTPHINYVLE